MLRDHSCANKADFLLLLQNCPGAKHWSGVNSCYLRLLNCGCMLNVQGQPSCAQSREGTFCIAQAVVKVDGPLSSGCKQRLFPDRVIEQVPNSLPQYRSPSCHDSRQVYAFFVVFFMRQSFQVRANLWTTNTGQRAKDPCRCLGPFLSGAGKAKSVSGPKALLSVRPLGVFRGNFRFRFRPFRPSPPARPTLIRGGVSIAY